MPLTYDESAALMNDANFRGKVKVSMLRYCDTILIEPDNTMGHTSRVRWAQQVMLQPEMWVGQIQPNVVMDPAIQEAGMTTPVSPALPASAATDIQIQSATEAVINKMV